MQTLFFGNSHLYCIRSYVDFFLQRQQTFLESYGECKDSPAKLLELHENLKPYLLRRVKRDVEKSLPSKQERILRVEMGRRQKDLYKMIINRNFSALRQASANMPTLNNILMQLKKCCNHAALITHEEVAVRLAAFRGVVACPTLTFICLFGSPRPASRTS
jgi:SNF2 family DNA or RNA helicase